MTLTTMSIFYIQKLVMFTTKESPKILKKDSQNITKTNQGIPQGKVPGSCCIKKVTPQKKRH